MEIEVKNLAELRKETAEGKVLVDFYATWCGPCKMIAPIVEKVGNELGLKIVKVDVDEAGDAAAEFGVMAIPTLVLFDNGKVVNQNTGYMAEPQLKAFCAK